MILYCGCACFCQGCSIGGLLNHCKTNLTNTEFSQHAHSPMLLVEAMATENQNRLLEDAVCVVTGSNSGIGGSLSQSWLSSFSRQEADCLVTRHALIRIFQATKHTPFLHELANCCSRTRGNQRDTDSMHSAMCVRCVHPQWSISLVTVTTGLPGRGRQERRLQQASVHMEPT